MTSGFVIGRRRGWGRGSALLIAVMVAGVVGLQSDAGAAARGAGWALHGDGGYVTSAQVVPGDEPSVVVVGTGEASAPAESAIMQVVVRSTMGAVAPVEGEGPVPSTPPALTEEQVQPVVDAIVAAGVPEDAIKLTISQAFGGAFGPGTAEIRLDLDAPELELMPDVLTAVTSPLEGLTVDTVNAVYAVADCDPLLKEARKDAATDARARAEALAEAVGLDLGGILLVSESQNYAGVPGVGCTPLSPGFQPGGKGTYLPTYDPAAPAEVEVYAQLNMAYAIA